MFKKKLGFLLGVMVLLSFAGYLVCLAAGSNKQLNKNDEFLLVTSFYPMYVLAENLTAGVEDVTVSNLTENQTGCLHDYQLFPEDMILLSRADAFLINGAGMELFMEKVIKSNSELPVIEASHGIPLLEGMEHHHHEEEEISYDSEHEHDWEEAEHYEYDDNDSAETEYAEAQEADDYDEHSHSANGHVWMDVIRYREQANVAARELQVLFPAYATEIKESYEQYEEKLATLSEEVQLLREEVKGQNVVIFHDAFAYLADSLSMHVIGVVALDEETVPSAGEIAELIEEIKYHGGAWILIEEAYASHAEKIVAETGARVLYLNPLVTGDGEKNSYLVGMRENIKVIREAVYGEALEGTTE